MSDNCKHCSVDDGWSLGIVEDSKEEIYYFFGHNKEDGIVDENYLTKEELKLFLQGEFNQIIHIDNKTLLKLIS